MARDVTLCSIGVLASGVGARQSDGTLMPGKFLRLCLLGMLAVLVAAAGAVASAKAAVGASSTLNSSAAIARQARDGL